MRRSSLLLALFVGIAGVLLSLAPSSLYGSQLLQACPYLQPGGPSFSSLAESLLGHAGRLVRLGAGAPSGRSGLLLLTRAALRAYDGSDDSLPLLLGMHGDIFDVKAKGSQFYGRGMGYNCFAGRDATRALALGSLDPKDIDNWRTDDFNEMQKQALAEQYAFYKGKYPVVGRIVEGDDSVARAAAAVEPEAPRAEGGEAKEAGGEAEPQVET